MDNDMTPEEREAADRDLVRRRNAASEARHVLDHINELAEQYVRLYSERYPDVPPLRARAQALWEVAWVMQSEMRAELQRKHKDRMKASDSSGTKDGGQ